MAVKMVDKVFQVHERDGIDREDRPDRDTLDCDFRAGGKFSLPANVPRRNWGLSQELAFSFIVF